MKNLLLHSLVLVVFLAGCVAVNTNQNIQYFKPINYTLDNLQLKLVHDQIYGRSRWNSTFITYFDNITDSDARQAVSDAANTWNNMTIIKFVEVTNPSKADFFVRYSIPNDPEGTTYYLGETQLIPSDTGLFNLSVKGAIIYIPRPSYCLNKITMMHEMGHILGLDHDSDTRSIMFPITSYNACVLENITNEINQTVNALYTIQPLPDLYFSQVTSQKIGNKISTNIVVNNRGLTTSQSFQLEIKINGKTESTLNSPSLRPGEGQLFTDEFLIDSKVANMTLVIDPSNNQLEIDRTNNIMILEPI